jgi:hypothetical protein
MAILIVRDEAETRWRQHATELDAQVREDKARADERVAGLIRRVAAERRRQRQTEAVGPIVNIRKNLSRPNPESRGTRNGAVKPKALPD